MAARSATHDTFVIRRTYAAPVDKVFRAWSDPARKARWFGGSPDAPAPGHELDFREGGHEFWAGGPPGGLTYTYRAQIRDIRVEERIVYTYEMHAGEDRISVSVATVEFRGSGQATELVITEQGVFLDDLDTSARREAGTHDLLDALDKLLSTDAR
jgi:uncharacterized protein YndB with AHSA1/START domain